MKTEMIVRIGSKGTGYQPLNSSSYTPQYPRPLFRELVSKIFKFLFNFISHKKIMHAIIVTAFMYVFLETLGFGLLTPLYVGCEEMIKEMIVRSF
ncbi:hypothetical protein CN918_31370 [Priestia megaterium]|nr:hypothetical protein CN918_31370 [Priestia megaterium]